MILMGIGEVINFVAYTIAPAILITPLGAFRVIVTSVLSAVFLKEKLKRNGKLGVILSLLGSTVIIIHAPQHEKISEFDELVAQMTSFGFSTYCFILITISLYLSIKVAPRHGNTNVLVYTTICNMVGALTVLCGKGLGIAGKHAFDENSQVLVHPLFWLLIACQIIGVMTQVFYLNKALHVFDASSVIPLQYTFTNIFIIYGSMLLFDELAYVGLVDCIGMLCGFSSIIIAVLLLSSKRREVTKIEMKKHNDKSVI